MSEKSSEVNLFPVYEAAQAILNEMKGDRLDQALVVGRKLLPDTGIEDLEEDDLIRINLSASAEEAANHNGRKAVELLEAAVSEIKGRLPQFRILLKDETDGWTDQALKDKAGRIWTAYLYDETRKVHIADVSPSYEMHYLYCTAENKLPDDLEELLVTHGDGGESIHYEYCRGVDAAPEKYKQDCGGPSDPGADGYSALVESEVEYYRSNVGIQVPRADALPLPPVPQRESSYTERPAPAPTLNVEQMTVSALRRFVAAVDKVMEANDLAPKERMDLIGHWAYQFARPDMPELLDAAIQRCQSNEDVHPTASSIMNKVSGEVSAYSGPSY